jgi:hypothetical protein
LSFDSARPRRLIVWGKLIGPWAAELTTAYETAKPDLQTRELIVIFVLTLLTLG